MIAPSGQVPGAGGTPPATRQVALVIWSALLFGVLAFAAVATFVGPRSFWGRGGDLAGILAPVAIGMAVVCLVLSRVVPARVKPVGGATPDAVGVTRTILASALNEGAALFAIIAWMLTGSALALVAWALSVAGLFLAFPSEARWRSLAAGPETPGAANRMVR